MKSTPIVSWTTVLRKGRSSGTTTPRKLAATMPTVMAATNPVSSWMASHRPATVITNGEYGLGRQDAFELQLFQEDLQYADSHRPTDDADPHSCRGAQHREHHAVPVACLQPLEDNDRDKGSDGIDSVASNLRIWVSLVPGRAARRMGVTTVGPETIRMAPSMTAVRPLNPSRSHKKACPGPGDQNADALQPVHHHAAIALQVGRGEIESPIKQDDGDSQTDQQRERCAKELVSVDGDGQRPSREADGEEQEE